MQKKHTLTAVFFSFFFLTYTMPKSIKLNSETYENTYKTTESWQFLFLIFKSLLSGQNSYTFSQGRNDCFMYQNIFFFEQWQNQRPNKILLFD